MKQDDNPNPFTFRVSGCGNTSKHNVTIVPPTNTKAVEGTPVPPTTDVNKDVFVLRIGRKVEGAEKKANLELELVTPKGKDKKPIPRKETRDTQYLESDIPDKKKKKDKGKGKGKGKSKKSRGKSK